MDEFIPFCRPDIGEEEIDEVSSSLRAGWLTTGTKVKRFEENFCHQFGSDSLSAIAVNSATAGLHLVLEALGVGPGDEVLTTTFTFTATAEVVEYLGATPVFVDIDTRTCNLDPSLLEEKIIPRTQVII